MADFNAILKDTGDQITNLLEDRLKKQGKDLLDFAKEQVQNAGKGSALILLRKVAGQDTAELEAAMIAQIGAWSWIEAKDAINEWKGALTDVLGIALGALKKA